MFWLLPALESLDDAHVAATAWARLLGWLLGLGVERELDLLPLEVPLDAVLTLIPQLRGLCVADWMREFLAAGQRPEWLCVCSMTPAEIDDQGEREPRGYHAASAPAAYASRMVSRD
jgi:hypothetical protein